MDMGTEQLGTSSQEKMESGATEELSYKDAQESVARNKPKEREQKERERVIREIIDRGACAISSYFLKTIPKNGEREVHSGGDGWSVRGNERWILPTNKIDPCGGLYLTGYNEPFVADSPEMSRELERLHSYGSLMNFRLWSIQRRTAPDIKDQSLIPKDFFQQHPIREFVCCFHPDDKVYHPEVHKEPRMVKKIIEKKRLFGLLTSRQEVELEEIVPVRKRVWRGEWREKTTDECIKGLGVGEAGEKVVCIYYHAEEGIGDPTKGNTDGSGRPYSFLETRFFLPQSLFEKFFPLLQKDPTMIRDISRRFLQQMTSQEDPKKISDFFPPYDEWDTDPKTIHGMYILGPDENRNEVTDKWDEYDDQRIYPIPEKK